MNSCRILLTTVLLIPALPATAVEVSRQAQQGPDRISASMTVQATLRDVQAALETPCAVKRWLPRVADVRVLDSDDEGRSRVRMTTDFPWPWKDRVATLQFHRQRPSADRLMIQMRAVPAPSREPTSVTITDSRATWQLRQHQNSVRVNYRQTLNPGGTVPQWLADRVAESQVRHAMENLRKLLEEEEGVNKTCHWRPADRLSPPSGNRHPP